MNKYLPISIIGSVLLLGFIILIMGISYSNQEINLRVTINAKMTDNKSEFDNMWKKISQVVQVTKSERASLSKLFQDYAQARTTSGGGEFMKWVQESVPNVGRETYVNLMNIITASRDAWTMRQKELIDFKREHDKLRQMFPSSVFVGMRPEIVITIITSDKTDDTFKKGKDNDVELGM